jgi:hypothetical protein
LKVEKKSKATHNKGSNKKAKVALLKSFNDSNSPTSLNEHHQVSTEDPLISTAFYAKLNKSMQKYAHDPDFPCLDFKSSDQSLKLEVN